MDTPLIRMADKQGRWSQTAGDLKAGFERARRMGFLLSIAGALGAAMASQSAGNVRTGLAVASAVVFAVAAFLTARFLGPDKASQWVRARAVSEAIKRVTYMRAAQAAPYDDATSADAKMAQDVKQVEDDADDLTLFLAAPVRGRTPTALLDAAGYIKQRVESAMAWYERSAETARLSAQRLRRIEFVLAAATAVLTAAIGAVSETWLRQTTGFDWVVLTSVLTTVSGAILAHIEASRYDFLTISYRATARRLGDELAAAPAAPALPSPEWSAFVDRCEAAIAQENGSWVARFGKKAGT